MSKKNLILLVAVLALSLSACQMRASTPPAATAAVMDANFPTVAATSSMNVVEQAGTQTAVALTGTPQGGEQPPAASTQAPAIATFTPLAGLQQTPVVVTNTPDPNALPSPTPGTQPQATAVTNTTKPGTYALKEGEFPYCIARRYNVNPDELLAINGLSDGGFYQAGLVLKLPTTGNPFPGSRALRTHPAAYTVLAGDTIYKIACAFGDVDPNNIISANNLQAPYTLTAGTQINIP